MAIPLRVVLLEDNPSDAELILYELRWAGLDPDSLRVQTEDDFLAALKLAPDLILADYRLPQYDGLRALETIKAKGLEIPFIIVSGNISEDLAANAIRRGAADYLLKDRLVRLGPAVKQALRNREIQQQASTALAALQESESRLHLAMKNSPVAVFNQDLDLRYTWLYNTLPGFSPQDALGKTDAERFLPDEAAHLTDIKRQVFATGTIIRQEIGLSIEGKTVYEDLSLEPMLDADGKIIGVAGVSVDITERKKAEQTLRRRNDYLVALQETTLDLLAQLDLDILLEKIVQRAGQLMNTSSGFLDLLDPKSGELRPQIGLGSLAESLQHAPQPGEGVAGKVWQTKEPLIVNDYDSWPDRIGTFSHSVLSSIIGVPLLVGDDLLGVLGLGHEHTHHHSFDQEDLDTLTQFGRLAVLAIENARLYTSAQEELAERERAEMALRESDERFRAIFDQAAMGIAQVATDGRWLRINQKLCTIIGYTREELLATSFQDITHPDDLNIDLHYVQQMLTGEINTYAMEKRYLRKDGSPIWTNLTVSLVHDDQGAPAYFISIIEDIAERKQTEEQMALQTTALAATANAIVITDHQGDLSWVNPAFTTMTGFTPEESLGHNLRDLVRSGFHDEASYADMWKTVYSGKVWHGELINRRKDGTFYAEEQTITPVRDARGTITHFVAIKQDISERRQAEELIHARLALLDYSTTHGLNAVLKETLDQVGPLVNSPIGFYHFVEEDQTSLSLQAWSTRTLAEYCHAEGENLHYPIDQAGVWADCVQTKKPVVHNDYASLSNRKGLPEGHAELIRELVVPILRADKVVAILGVGNKPTEYSENDITLVTYFADVAWEIAEQKRAEAERERLMVQIRVQAKQMEQVLATVPAGVLMLDAEGRVLQANPVAQKDLVLLAGAQVGEIITHLGDSSLDDLFTSPPTKGLWHEIKTDKHVYEAIARPMEVESTAEHWVLVLNEITQAREIQTQLQQQERLASVGQLAAGIAHDFNNIMAVIVLYSQMVARSEEIGDRNREKMETINQQAWHASRLIQQLLDFSRRSVLQRQPLDLLPLLKEQVKLLERTLSEDVVLHLDYGEGEYTINADPTRIQQMITNLAINARDAMPSGGTLHMDLSRIEIKAIDAAQIPIPGAAMGATVGATVGLAAGEWIKLTLKDTGTGISPDILSHIFDPFFTTKQVGSGTGLGLAQVHGIVGQHGGHIAVESIVGQGTTFTIHLPAQSPYPQEPSLMVDTTTTPQGHGELILVVEDQEFVRAAVVDGLEAFGYQIIEARNGKEALEIMQHRGNEVALILSDVLMPVMGGIMFFHTLRDQAWTTPFILLTGHPLDDDFKALRKKGLNAWLSKPPNLEQLAQTIAQALQDAKP